MYEQDYLDYLSLPPKLYDRIEENVVDLLIQLNIRSFPIDPMEIALRLGYELVPFSKMNREAKRILVPKDVDGVSHYGECLRALLPQAYPTAFHHPLR